MTLERNLLLPGTTTVYWVVLVAVDVLRGKISADEVKRLLKPPRFEGIYLWLPNDCFYYDD